jgi:hypothetical protein
LLHLALHFLVPALLVGVLFRNQQLGNKVLGDKVLCHKVLCHKVLGHKVLGARWQVAYLILIATMVVDIDHLLANPIYDPNRCSIGFHPLHQPGFIGLYLLLCFIPKTRLIGLGLTIHMLLDSIDCQVTNGIWIN